MVNPIPNQARLDSIVAEARRHSAEREATYRERALKLYPWVCGRCAREFAGVRLRELTVHHKIITMTIIRLMVVTGSCFVFIAMKMSMHAFWINRYGEGCLEVKRQWQPIIPLRIYRRN